MKNPLNSDRWWGWGQTHVSFDVSRRSRLTAYLFELLGTGNLERVKQFDLAQVTVAPSKATSEDLEKLHQSLPSTTFTIEDGSRIKHSSGKSYRDLIMLRSGHVPLAPDVIFFPSNLDELIKIVQLAGELSMALVPFGGGTSVVGGVDSIQGSCRLVGTVSLRRMNRLLSFDRVSETACFEAGILGPELENSLNEKGYTLGHFPQSFEFSTLGGWIATRSSGQNSAGNGRISDMTRDLRVLTPSGEVNTIDVPAHACGPDLKELFLGSEGVLGIIVSATMKVHKLPKSKLYFMCAFKSFAQATESCRTLVQEGVPFSLLRISDEQESMASLKMSEAPKNFMQGLLKSAFKAYAALRGFSFSQSLSLVLVGIEGDPDENRRVAAKVRRFFSKSECLHLGRAAGEHWLKERFALPYLRDRFIDNGFFIETLETATSWSNLPKLYEGVRESLTECFEKDGLRGVVLTHVSHFYRDGASLYFTVLVPAKRADSSAALLEQWRDYKTAASQAIIRCGGIISHHHGIGIDHREYTPWGKLDRKLLQRLKSEVDPLGLLNPGKLFLETRL